MSAASLRRKSRVNADCTSPDYGDETFHTRRLDALMVIPIIAQGMVRGRQADLMATMKNCEVRHAVVARRHLHVLRGHHAL